MNSYNRKVVDGDQGTNNALESWISASMLDTVKMDKSLALYKIIAKVQGSERESHINIVAAYYNYWKVYSGSIICSLIW